MRFVLPHAPRPAPGLAAPARPVPLRPYRRPQAAAGDALARPAHRDPPASRSSRVHARLRIFRLLGRRRAAGRAQRARRRRSGAERAAPAPSCVVARRRDGGPGGVEAPRPHQAAGETSRRACWSTPPGPGSNDVLAETPASERARQEVRLVKGSHIVVPPPVRRSRAPTSSRTPTGASSSPFPTRRLHADRHHRHRGMTAIRPRRQASRGGDRVSLRRRRASYFAAAGEAPRTWSGPIPACARSMTTARAVGGDARLHARARRPPARRCCRHLRRQDHHLPPPCRRGMLEIIEPQLGRKRQGPGPATAPCRAATCSTRSQRLRRRSGQALKAAYSPSSLMRQARPPARAGLRHARQESCSAWRSRKPISGAISAPISTRREVRYLIAHEWAVSARTCCGGAPSSGCAHARSKRGARRISARNGRQACTRRGRIGLPACICLWEEG
jgi:hypothetical protein